MEDMFWTGRLSPYCRALVNANCVVAWLTGGIADRVAMKRRVQMGYDGACTDHVERYDDLGMEHYGRTGELLLNSITLSGKRVLDVGCGTGIVSFLALDRGAAEVVGGDYSAGILRHCVAAARERGEGKASVAFLQLDAERLPVADASFDAVVSSMVLGFLPDQPRAVAEMARVARPGGWVAVATHGPNHYWEAIDAAIRAARKRYLLGYRFEMWFRSPGDVEAMMRLAGLQDVATQSARWMHGFASGAEAYDFFACTSSAWWLGRHPPEIRDEESRRLREYFARRGVTTITSDIVLGVGRKAPAGPARHH